MTPKTKTKTKTKPKQNQNQNQKQKQKQKEPRRLSKVAQTFSIGIKNPRLWIIGDTDSILHNLEP